MAWLFFGHVKGLGFIQEAIIIFQNAQLKIATFGNAFLQHFELKTRKELNLDLSPAERIFAVGGFSYWRCTMEAGQGWAKRRIIVY